MKTSFKSFLALAAFGASALISQAQLAPKILIVDLAKVFQGHYKTAEQQEAINVVSQKAEQDLGNLNKEINDLIAKYKDSDEQTKNPALTPDAKTKAAADTEKIGEAIRAKQNEGQNFVANTRRTLAERSQNFQNLLIDEISKVAADIAKSKGATLLLNKPAAVYYDASADITDDVLALVNKGKPAATTQAPVATPAAKPAAATPGAKPAGDGAPTIAFPGSKK